MRVFALTVLLAQSVQVPVLAKNVTLNCGEDCPCQDSTRFFPVPKVQGGQMHIMARSHPCGASRCSTSTSGASPNRASSISSISATSTAAAASTAAAVAASLSLSAFTIAVASAVIAAATSPTDQLFQRQRQ